MKNKKFLCLSCSIVILLVSSSSYLLATNRELFFGPVITGLEGTGVLTSKSLKDGAALKGARTETLHFSLDVSKTSLKSIRGKDYVRIEDLKPYGNPGEPQIPFKSFIVTLPINSEVSGVSVSGVSYRPILNKLDIVLTPMPVSRTIVSRTTNKDEKQTKNAPSKGTYSKCKTCDLESFFPGNLVSYDTGKDNNNRYVFVKFFPVQYIPDSKRAILITNADITVNYQLTHTERTGENRK